MASVHAALDSLFLHATENESASGPFFASAVELIKVKLDAIQAVVTAPFSKAAKGRIKAGEQARKSANTELKEYD